MWTVPVGALEELSPAAMEKDMVLATPSTMYLMGRVARANYEGDRVFVSINDQPSTSICYFLKAEATGVKVNISDAAGNSVADLTGTGKVGLNVVNWSGRGRRGLVAGDYRVTLTVGEKTLTAALKVEQLASTGGDE